MEYINKVLKCPYGNTRDLKKEFIKYYNDLSSTDKDGSLYHKVVRSNANLRAKYDAIEMLINNGVNQNIIDSHGYTYMHLFLLNYDYGNISYIINLGINNNFDTNIKDNNGFTILHLSIKSCQNINDIMRLMIILEKNNFDFSVLDNNGHNIIEFIFSCDKFTYNEKIQLKNFIDDINNKKQINNNPSNRLNVDSINKYGVLLNTKCYDKEPAIAREKEVNDLIVSLATDKKVPILVGPSGVGKTSIVDELVYRIKNNEVPKFLQNKYIFELHLSNAVAGAKYRGEFEEHLSEVFKFAIKNDVILFIDEFHTVFGTGASEYDKNDAAAMIKTYIDRYNLKVIGATTTEEYNEYIVHDALKRRFDVIKVNELDNSKLHDVVLSTINNYAIFKHVLISNDVNNYIDQIINILLELTQEKNRRFDDKTYNPDLLVSIIDRAFAYLYVDNDYELEIKHFIMAINDNERIYDYSKEEAIKKLNHIDIVDNKNVDNNIIDFNEYKKKHVLV